MSIKCIFCNCEGFIEGEFLEMELCPACNGEGEIKEENLSGTNSKGEFMSEYQLERDRFYEENKEGIKVAWEDTQDLTLKLFDNVNKFIKDKDYLTDNEKFLIISRALHQTYIQYCNISYSRHEQ